MSVGLYGVSDLNQRGLKTRHCTQGCDFRGSERCFAKFWDSNPQKL